MTASRGVPRPPPLDSRTPPRVFKGLLSEIESDESFRLRRQDCCAAPCSARGLAPVLVAPHGDLALDKRTIGDAANGGDHRRRSFALVSLGKMTLCLNSPWAMSPRKMIHAADPLTTLSLTFGSKIWNA